MIQTTAAQTAQFLHLSDIHFDPFYTPGGDFRHPDPGMVGDLIDKPVNEWEAYLKTKSGPVPVTQQGQDTNYALLQSLLTKAMGSGKYDYVVYTGDYLRHDFVRVLKDEQFSDGDIEMLAEKTVEFVNAQIAEALPNAPLITSLGNNDSSCGDYNLTPNGDILAKVAADVPAIANNPLATTTFKKGGYYLTPHPKVANVDFLALSVFWSNKYDDVCDEKAPDPAVAQTAWLKTVLATERKAGRKVILLMHIPPGIDGFSTYRDGKSDPANASPKPLWNSTAQYLANFESIASSYQDIIIGAYAGHTHMDEFRVLADTKPYLAIRMGPSVTPSNGNRPSFTVFDYDPSTGAALDYRAFNFDGANWANYSFSGRYGFSSYSAANLTALASQIRTQPAIRQKFTDVYAAGNSTPMSKSADWPFFACALTDLHSSDYSACIKNPDQ